jgi:hypothetical protein
VRRLVWIRAGYGIVLMLAPGVVLRGLPHRRIDGAARAFARLLGARHLVQAAVTIRGGYGPGWILAGAAVDGAHLACVIALAVARPDRRLLASANALAAAVFAAAGVIEADRARRPA